MSTSSLLRRHCLLSLLVLGCSLAFLPTPAMADAGPKPEMWVYVTYEGKALPDGKFTSRLLTCQAPGTEPAWRGGSQPQVPGIDQLGLTGPDGCLWKDPDMLVWGGEGENGRAHFTYMLPSRFRVAIYVPSLDRTFVTPEAERSGMRSRFSINLAADGTARIDPARLPFWESDWTIEGMCLALPLTLVIELGIVWFWSRISRGSWRRLLLICLAVNVVTLPVLWLLTGTMSFFAGGTVALITLAVLEVATFAFESALYWKPGNLRVFSAIALAAVANLSSFLVGLLIH
jgi:hypothetical protein